MDRDGRAGIAICESTYDARQEAEGQGRQHRDLEAPRLALADVGGALGDLVERAEGPLDFFEQELRFVRRREPALGAVEKIEAQSAFELRDEPADGRLRDAQHLGRALGGAGRHDGPEGLDLPDVHRAPPRSPAPTQFLYET